jgi:hypothetical protein
MHKTKSCCYEGRVVRGTLRAKRGQVLRDEANYITAN